MVIGVVPAPAPELIAAPEVEPSAPAPRSGPPAPGMAVVVLTIIMVVSVIGAFFGAFAFALGGLQEQRSQHQLYSQFRGLLDPSSPLAPEIGGSIPAGFPIALLNSPVAGLHNVVVVEGTSSGVLLAGPGHLADSPLPGQAGRSVLVGRSATAGAPFGGITRLRKGDVISVRTGQGPFRYAVEDQRVAGDRFPALPAGGSLLTLVTSAGSGGLGRLAPTHLVYVDAHLLGKVAGAPRGRPATVSAAAVPGHNDPAAWPFVVLWLLALVAGTIICWRLWSRWGILQTWLVGTPVLLAILWGLSTEAMRLLPNVY
jgi:sortase A